MRLLGSNTHKITINDGEDKHVFYYRRPTADELTAYQASLFSRKGDKLINRTGQARLKAGKMVCLGFDKGTLANLDGSLISSEKSDPDYEPSWKDLIAEWAPEYFIRIGEQAFEAARVEERAIEFDSPLFDLFEEDDDNPLS